MRGDGESGRATLSGAREVILDLKGISKSFGKTVAVHPVDLSIAKGDFFALLGPSGCGKTTLLKIIGGFITPDTGTIRIESRDVTADPPERRRTSLVFQGYGLFPHMTVRQNIGYGLRVARRPAAELRERVDGMLSLVQLESQADRLPHELSGGQQQRVALARSLVTEPAVLLLDESLAALDLKLRRAMQEELRALHKSIGGTFVFVTHDQGEAMAMANRIAVMNEGRIIQEGAPHEIYNHPRSTFVASFIGDANLLQGRVRQGFMEIDGTSVRAPASGPERRVTIVVRPRCLRIGRSGRPSPGEARLVCRVTDVVFMGTYHKIGMRSESGIELVAHVAPEEWIALGAGPEEEVDVSWNHSDQQIMEAGP
ncbi:ABC transporter ATP-binding protein [Aestuariivirga sp.]|uniref:ABC transporter ATP-binding protein n=1 Tax=Aestuariivirga sp. TaxID=2650926 RepID=UPI00391BF749